ncbi:MAG: phospholipid carrier-dependent glycosyltransferase [Ignavibacteria bacterium]|jgi:4-amino-4-deoxy-L-arabinose transferase-like glycosyltransferase|nr:phospholipid carrier-dependent glycosyltransferase [Ignavibacteria bacterium]
MKQKENKPNKQQLKKQRKQKPTFSFHDNKMLFYLGAALISIVFWAVYSTTFDAKIYPSIGDNLGYYGMGRSIASGDIWVYGDGNPSNHFPPGFSTIMGIILLFTSGSVATVKIMEGVMVFLSVLMMYLLSHKLTKNIFISLALGLILATNANLLYYGTIMMSEVPAVFFITLTLLCFYYLMNYILHGDIQNKKQLYLLTIATGFAAGYSQLTRSMSVFLPVSVIATLAVIAVVWKIKNKKNENIENRKNLKPIITALIGFTLMFAITIAPWSIRNQVFGLNKEQPPNPNFEINSYAYQMSHRSDHTPIDMTDLGFWKDRIWNNAGIYISRAFPRVLAVTAMENKEKDWTPMTKDYIVGWTLVVLCLLGFVPLWKQNKYFTLLIMLMTFSVVALLSVWLEKYIVGQHCVRYVLPMICPLMLLLVSGISSIANFLSFLIGKFKNPPPQQPLIYQALTAFLLVLFLLICRPTYSEAIAILQARADEPPVMQFGSFPGISTEGHPQTIDLGAAFIWCHQNLPNQRIMVRPWYVWELWPHDPPCIMYPPNLCTEEEALAYLVENDVKYLVLDTWMARSYATIGPCINKYSEKFKILYKKDKAVESIEDTYVIEFNNDWGLHLDTDANGNPTGKGKLSMQNGNSYVGAFNAAGYANGYGVMYDSTGKEIARGNWKNGTLE